MFETRASPWSAQAEKTKDAFRSFFELTDPTESSDSAKELQEIRAAFEQQGEWSRTDEWRISTRMTASIKREDAEGREGWLRVTVECDGQVLSCGCPTLERAFAFYRLYAHLIIYQFYSVGPPWAG
jgi:hypothetical protein